MLCFANIVLCLDIIVLCFHKLNLCCVWLIPCCVWKNVCCVPRIFFVSRNVCCVCRYGPPFLDLILVREVQKAFSGMVFSILFRASN